MFPWRHAGAKESFGKYCATISEGDQYVVWNVSPEDIGYAHVGERLSNPGHPRARWSYWVLPFVHLVVSCLVSLEGVGFLVMVETGQIPSTFM
mmetsp:Transcript_11327/g.26255  ORF Transcript_11327/g.26255 Transcript_11327/m.26255 type:complete len:93 (+) Transcript_11327:274-552(+)